MLRAENLVKRFEDKTALDGLNTEIRRGCIYGLVGPNGSGKSTLMRLMCGVYRPDGGRVTLEGEDIFENIAAKDRILYLSDDLYFPPKSTVEDLASFYRGLYSGFSMETYHTLCGVLSAANRSAPFHLQQGDAAAGGAFGGAVLPCRLPAAG